MFNSLSSFSNDETGSFVSDEETKRQEAEFMYAGIVRDILVQINSTEVFIDEFQEYYDPCNAIFWYTRDTFLYRFLNKALREQDIDTLYGLRYFIKDLHEQLIELHHLSKNDTKSTANANIKTMYRGQLMNLNEFNKKIRYHMNGFLSVNTFLSTTTNKELAIFFVNGEIVHILFQINADESITKFPFAKLSKKSAFGNDEGEILFAMGAVFRIMLMDNELWHVTLKLTDEEDDDLCKLTKYVKNDIVQPIPLVSLAKLMGILARYDKAENFYILSFGPAIASQNAGCIAAVYNDLGLNYKLMEQINKAIRCFQISLDLKCKHFTNADTNPSLAITYNNLGGVYFSQQEYELAALMYRNAARIHRASTNPDQISLAICYNNIGTVCKEIQRYEEALLMYEMSLEIRLSVLPRTHPMIATTCNNIAHTYYLQGHSEKAAEYWKKTLLIQQTSLPSDHLLLGKTYQSLSIVSYEHGFLEQALEYAKKSQKVNSVNFPTDHPKVKEENEWISQVEEELDKLHV
ncbi:unnamed protein product [Adineta ricciae]|uniref:Kinesin light chain n=1 Tax=Adineta ricciae TaxID=249248 RepID=A0A815EN81_ADIRI|nr:unnamed protein product [Adineta ricciae]CAF1317557.1 unnamed protein product [Adineta ricciae]